MLILKKSSTSVKLSKLLQAKEGYEYVSVCLHFLQCTETISL